MNKKCKIIKKRFLRLCDTLMQRINSSSYEKGFCLLNFIDLETGSPVRDYVAYRKNSKDKGLVLNFCPFCGKNLHKKFNEENDEGYE